MFADAITKAAEAQPHTIIATPLVPGLTVHIDGDFLAYNAAGNDDTLPGEARLNCLGKIEVLRARVGAEHVVVHSTVPYSNKGERYLVATVKPYQDQRKSSRKPKNQPYLQEFLQSYDGDVFRSKLWSTREADDGIAACCHFAVGTPVGYTAIATKDKDLRMLPGVHINWDSLAVTRVHPGDYDVIGEDGKQYGLKFFFLQMLMGDTADNCPGLERYTREDGKAMQVGEVTAGKLLADCTTTAQAADRVALLYRGYYEDAWADRFCEQAALLWMRLGNDGAVDDFATHAGHSRINTTFCDDIAKAVVRLNERVKIARQQIDALQHQECP